MPTIYTMPAGVVYGAGKGLGQIDREQEAHDRGVQKAQLELQQQQVRNQRVATALQHISQRRAQRSADERAARADDVASETRKIEQERYGDEIKEDKRRYEKNFAYKMSESARQREADVAKMKGAEYKPTTFEEAVKFDKATQKPKTESYTSKYRKALRQYAKGDVNEEVMRDEFPDKLKNTKSFKQDVDLEKKKTEKLERQPLKRLAKWDVRRMFGDTASEQDEITSKEMRTVGDLIRFYHNQRAFAAMGVNVQLFLDHYSKKINELGVRGYLE